MSDFTMALGDTFRNLALGRFPNSEMTLAVIGVTKSIAVCLESPIITILHASTALSVDRSAHKALRRFTSLLSLCLTLIFVGLCYEPISLWLFCTIFGFTPDVASIARFALVFMIPWPAAIAFRRFFQGILIRNRQEKEMSIAAGLRLTFTVLTLMIGYRLQFDAIVVAVISLIGAVVVEALVVIFYARALPTSSPPNANLPTTTKEVARYYLPLGATSIVVWFGKAALVAVIAHAHDGMLAIAAWTAASGLFLPIANSTRMLQQVVIAEPKVSRSVLFRFSLGVGLLASIPLVGLGFTFFGEQLLEVLVGTNNELISAVIPSLKILFVLPALVAIQNYLQGQLIVLRASWWINFGAVINIAIALSLTFVLSLMNMSGVIAGAFATMISLIAELAILSLACAHCWRAKSGH